jgi:hypothetical protein
VSEAVLLITLLLIGWPLGQLHILSRQITAIVLLEDPAIIIFLQIPRACQPVLIVPDLAVMRSDTGLK